MKKVTLLLWSLIIFTSNYANADWVDFGNWFGGSDLCVSSSWLTEETCGMPIDPIHTIAGPITNTSYALPNLRNSVKCHYYFSTGSCCCEGLVWAPDAPENLTMKKVFKDRNSIRIAWDPDIRPESVEDFDIYASVNRPPTEKTDLISVKEYHKIGGPPTALCRLRIYPDDGTSVQICGIYGLDKNVGDTVYVKVVHKGRYGSASSDVEGQVFPGGKSRR